MPTVNTIQKLWEDMPQKRLEKNQGALDYICALASQANVNISRWNIKTTFGKDDEGNLMTDPRDLNKAFYAKLLEVKPRPARSADVKSDRALLAALRRHAKNMMATEIRDAKADYDRQLRTSQDRYRQYVMALTNATQANLKLERLQSDTELSKRAETIADSIADVLEGGFWTEPVVHNGALWLQTAKPITLTYKKASANIDVSVNLGRFAAKLTMSDRPSVLVYPFAKNKATTSSRFYHPHVNTGGDICWGNVREKALNHLTKWNFGKVLGLLQGLLSSYSDGNPYRPLQDFTTAGAFGAVPRDWRYPPKPAPMEDDE